jgi:predicted anti-sigma-YlaC factor YlaD
VKIRIDWGRGMQPYEIALAVIVWFVAVLGLVEAGVLPVFAVLGGFVACVATLLCLAATSDEEESPGDQ